MENSINTANNIKNIVLGAPITLDDFIAVARYSAAVEFSEEYCRRVEKSRELVEQWVSEEKVMYGVTTGFGALCTKAIGKDETAKLQENIILSHSVSVGEPLSIERVRGIMLMVLQNLGQGYSGVRLTILEYYKDFLNKGITPWTPGDGSVGYLAPEAHMALVLLGRGKAWYEGELLEGGEALKRAGMRPLELSSKEGLALVSGTTSPTAMAALAIYDLLNAAKAADIIGSATLEACKGVMNAFDERVMSVRPHSEQAKTAENVRTILNGSGIIEKYKGSRVQDALSLRCIPQLHGASKKTLKDAKEVIEIEMNSCCDNPIIWPGQGNEDVISACNADSSYVGIEMDSACIAAAALAKMSERRNNRLIDESLSGNPWFCIKTPGLNSGLMIPQYTQAGLLNEMRILATPATIDNTPTCGNQEDYVAMGYNACKKAGSAAEKLEYILAIELLSAYETQQFLDTDVKRSAATEAVMKEIGRHVPIMEQDMFLHPYIEYLRELIHSGHLIRIVESITGTLN
ncbi:HAL/PAL/TAL family ammonia-lyase [[Clostridium] symbiosum]|uniref:HAL/PAL/TAL family ammonia-lyase n=1 Tax=Clostridium symbiosum TaxID=1512 RepID=UPI0025A4977D|nr:aromatic amino acid ammonia-lyase [[Clostridium] symbiosum]MDM8136731.1 aromatic amino acid ammonia-lyase [[Clostridium] symbiosum]MDM8140993.1 aromatic amino acid ammonia-lyase [[Clostridium] symbiosum]MDM8320691.1 aromatic amino acid ammonia-lyase [[Clostridium] symbiosum]